MHRSVQKVTKQVHAQYKGRGISTDQYEANVSPAFPRVLFEPKATCTSAGANSELDPTWLDLESAAADEPADGV